jgi:pyrophosphatase PpaX
VELIEYNENMKKYNYFLFDWDGCLADTLTIWLKAYKQLFIEFHLHPTDKEISEKVFGSWTGPLNVGLQQKDLEEYIKKLLVIVNANFPKVKLNPNAKTILKDLKNHGKKLAIITTSIRSSLLPALKNNELLDIFDAIITGEDVSKQKPDPESVIKATKIMKGCLTETVMIGDSEKDIELAKNSGIDSALYYFPEYHSKFYDLEKWKIYKPTYIINDFFELKKYI